MAPRPHRALPLTADPPLLAAARPIPQFFPTPPPLPAMMQFQSPHAQYAQSPSSTHAAPQYSPSMQAQMSPTRPAPISPGMRSASKSGSPSVHSSASPQRPRTPLPPPPRHSYRKQFSKSASTPLSPAHIVVQPPSPGYAAPKHVSYPYAEAVQLYPVHDPALPAPRVVVHHTNKHPFNKSVQARKHRGTSRNVLGGFFTS